MCGMIWIMTIINVKWNHILASLQNFLALNIWMGVTMSAIIHPIWRLNFPRSYARYAERKRQQSEEAKRKRLQRNAEGGAAEVPGHITDLEVGLNEQTPILGREFSRMGDGAYVEIPGYSEDTAESEQETRS